MSRRLLAAGGTPCHSQSQILMREFIHACLYDESGGFFARESPVVAPMKQGPVWGVRSKEEYYEYVASQYRKGQNTFLTPSEIFSPLLGQCVAHYVMHEFPEGVRIVEIGSGSGTMALDVITEMKRHSYQLGSFTSVEISKVLSARQGARLGHANHGDVYRSIHADATQRKTWEQFEDGVPTLIIGMEVLDNLAHDKVQVSRSGVWQQTLVDMTERREVLAPVTDETIGKVLDSYETNYRDTRRPIRDTVMKFLLDATGVPDPVWLPTGAFQLFDAVRNVRHEMLLCDFDFLPGVVLAGENAPLVSSVKDGRAVDRGELLSAAGRNDIFFPTRFSLLGKIYEDAMGGRATRVETMKHRVFVERVMAHSPELRASATLSDTWCPLLEDYENTSCARLSTL